MYLTLDLKGYNIIRVVGDAVLSIGRESRLLVEQ